MVEFMAKSLDYEATKSRRDNIVLQLAPIALLVVSVVIGAGAFEMMDQRRLYGDGARPYFMHHVPFVWVWVPSAVGVVLGVVGTARSHSRFWPIAGTLANLMWSAHWLRRFWGI